MGFYDETRERWERDELQRWQGERLRRLLGRMLPDNAFYRRKLRRAGVDAGQIRSVADLPKLPLTRKSELVEAQRREPPYGGLNTFPLSAYRYQHGTSGTSGRPLLWLDSEEDWATWRRCWGHVYRGAGVGEADSVLLAFSFGPYISHWTAAAGATEVGALRLPAGGMGSVQRLQLLIERRATVLVSTPTYALHLGEVAARQGIDLASSDIRITIHAGEPGASVPNVRRRIEAIWGARCYDHAGATEIGAWAFPCEAAVGAPHLNELEFIFELLDPATGEPVADGERGELVITTLGRPGMPVLRYCTGDLAVRTHGQCACGRHLARIEGGVLGRADDMLIVRGVNVYPSAVDNLLRGVPEVAEYEVEVRREGGMDDLCMKVETLPEASFETVREHLEAAFRERLNLRIELVEAAAGSLPRYELKAKRFKRVDS